MIDEEFQTLKTPPLEETALCVTFRRDNFSREEVERIAREIAPGFERQGELLSQNVTYTEGPTPQLTAERIWGGMRFVKDKNLVLTLQNVAMETGAACYVRSGALRIRESLQWLTRKYCVGNWNGYGERAISAKSWEAAYRFAQTLPDWVAGAEAVVDADGEVSIEWYVSKDCYLELSFAESGNVHCYFKAPDCKCSDIFASKEDKRILELVARMSHA